jgi:hypothetical protein
MGVGLAIELSDLLPYLVGILGLLLLWQYHEKQVLAGRIQAIDIFDRSGIRMYITATPDDDQVCDACRETNGTVFLPSRVADGGYRAHLKPCSNGGKCSPVLVGLYGAWLEARSTLARLRDAKKTGFVRLEPEQFLGLVKGNWEDSVSAATDRLSVIMLVALGAEKVYPDSAMAAYWQVIQQAKEVRDLPLVVPAYLRLADLLSRQGRPDEALAVIQEFEDRYPRHGKSKPYGPKETQRGLMAIKKSRLKTAPTPTKTSVPKAPLAETGSGALPRPS